MPQTRRPTTPRSASRKSGNPSHFSRTLGVPCLPQSNAKRPRSFSFLSEFSEGPTEAPKGGLLCWGEREGFRTPRNPDEILFQLNMILPVWNTSANPKHPNTQTPKQPSNQSIVHIMRLAGAFSRTPWSLRLSSPDGKSQGSKGGHPESAWYSSSHFETIQPKKKPKKQALSWNNMGMRQNYRFQSMFPFTRVPFWVQDWLHASQLWPRYCKRVVCLMKRWLWRVL